MPDYVVLLRAIGPGNTMPMADLRAMCVEAGLDNPQTYIASGNLIVGAPHDDAGAVAALVEDAIRARFSLAIEAVVRPAARWRAYAETNPFDGDPAALAKMVHLGLSNAAPAPDALAALQARAADGERVRQVGDAIWIDYGEIGAGRTRLTPAVINRLVGAPVTQRNLNTVRKLADLIETRP